MRQPGWAQIAASPVKISEYLATGLPVVSTAGVGDIDGLLESTRTGVIVHSLTADEFERAAISLVALLQDKCVVERCRRLAEERFSLSAAVEKYHCLYEQVTCKEKK
jgi:glycogen synthase